MYAIFLKHIAQQIATVVSVWRSGSSSQQNCFNDFGAQPNSLPHLFGCMQKALKTTWRAALTVEIPITRLYHYICSDIAILVSFAS